MAEQEKAIVVIDEMTIKSKIYKIRNKKVMLDFDLAEIYGYETRAFNQQVKRNHEKFEGEDFMFRLTDEETIELSRSQNVILNKGTGRGSNIKYNPYAFTEQGIYMLMTVLKGELAIRQSRALVRMFKQMKDYLIENRDFITAKEQVNIIIFSDNYKNKDMLTKNILNDFQKDYPNVDLKLKIAGRKYHDRYIAIDYGTEYEAIYHCGSSSKDAGNKISSITKIEELNRYMYHTMFDELIKNRELQL